VKLLALAEARTLHREQVIDALWPDLSVEAAGPRLHKAAHYARRALGDQARALPLRNDLVQLLPDADVVVDAVRFRPLMERAAKLFAVAGQPLDAARCDAKVTGPLPLQPVPG
jgi:DNA-binding SARP family transcriptional activator